MKYEALLLKLIKWGVVLTIFTPLILGPFGISLSNWPKAVFFRIIVEIIFILYLSLIYINPKYLPRLSFLIWANVVFFGILFLSALLGVNFYRSFFGDLYRAEGLVLHLHFLIFLIVATAVFFDKNDWIKFLKITVVVSAISSFAGILQKIGTLPFYKANPFSFYGVTLPVQISGTWTNPDFFAPYIVLCVFLGLYLLSLENNKKWKNILISISALNMLALILSGCRSSWIGFSVGVIFFFVVQLSRSAFFSAKAKKALLAGFLFLSIVGLFIALNKNSFSYSKNYFLKRVSTVFDANSILYSGRLYGWDIAVSAWRDRPILGWGPESYAFLFDKYFKAEYIKYIPSGIFFDRPHNKVLGIMATSGTVGALAYLGLFSAIFYFILKNYKKNPTGNLFLMAFFISYFIQNLFMFDTIGTYYVFFIVVGFINNIYGVNPERRLSERKRKYLLKTIVVAPLMAISVLAIYSLNLKPTLACRDFVKGIYRLDNKDYEGTISYYYKGMNEKTIYDEDFQKEFAERALLLINGDNISQDLIIRVVKTLSELRAPIEKSLEVPDRRRLAFYKALAIINEKDYSILGDENGLIEMDRILNKSMRFNKDSADQYQLLGVLRIYQKNYPESDYFFQKFFDLGGRNNRTSIWRQMGVVYARVGENKIAVENFKKYLIGEIVSAKMNKLSSEGYSKIYLQRIFSFSADLINFYKNNLNDKEEPKKIINLLVESYPEYEKWINANLGILI